MISYIFNRNVKFNLNKILNFSFFALFLLLSVNVNAQDAAEAAPAVSSEVAYILNTFLFLVCGFLVMFMAAGFCMLEAGQVRSKNTAVICLKNIGLFSIAGLMYFLVGYNLMYDGVDGGYMGSFSLFDSSSFGIAEGGHFADFARGIINVYDIIFYISVSTIFLVLTIFSLESRRWR